jgi:hypothetical protein
VGLIEQDITPERVGAIIDRASDMADAKLVDSQQAEIELYMQAFPMADGRVAKSLPAEAFTNRRPPK